jgi:hypothetical protein
MKQLLRFNGKIFSGCLLYSVVEQESGMLLFSSPSSFTPSSYRRLCAVHAWDKNNLDNVQINVIIIYSGAVWLKLCTVD